MMASIKNLPVDERPRERLLKNGVESLSLQELLSLVLGRGVKGESITDIAQKLISYFHSLNKLSETSVKELVAIKGLGLAKACQLKACFEIGRRLKTETSLNDKNTKMIKAPKDIYPLFANKISNFHKEHFMIGSLDNRNKIISVDIVSIGTLNSSLIHPREAFEMAIKNHAAGIIICHNHPSGELKPSEDDLAVTSNLIKAGTLLGIEVADHLIICQSGYYSFKEDGII